MLDEDESSHPAAPVRSQKRIDFTDFRDQLGPYSENTLAENLPLEMKMPNLRVVLSLSAAGEIKMIEIR